MPSVTRDPRCLEKRKIPNVSEFDGVVRFCKTIPTVKFISSSEIYKIFGFLIEITILQFFRKIEFSLVLHIQPKQFLCQLHLLHILAHNKISHTSSYIRDPKQ